MSPKIKEMALVHMNAHELPTRTWEADRAMFQERNREHRREEQVHARFYKTLRELYLSLDGLKVHREVPHWSVEDFAFMDVLFVSFSREVNRAGQTGIANMYY